jgi:acetylornithine deacetylase/succinyl-diaminopimelate desuccinylase-like protein
MTLLPLLVAASLTAASPALAAPDPLEQDAVAKLQALIQVNTTNPPGNEAAAARLMASWLKAEGIPYRLYESAPGRLNLVARLAGAGRQRPLMLLSHLDVVTADPSHWKYPPFSGALAEGAIWGRGAIDTKSLGVMEYMAFAKLHREHRALDRDVILAATADEEAGGDYGARWMIQHHPEEVACSELLNEGAAGVTTAGAPVMGIQTTERGVLWVRVTAHGTPGHGSMHRPDGATRKLVRALARLEEARPQLELIPEVRSMLEALAEVETSPKAWALRALSQPWLLPAIGPRAIATEPALATLISSTWNTTVLAAGSKVNVMPGEAAAEIDIRVLPGHTHEELFAWLKRTLADDSLTYEVLEGRDPTSTQARGPLYQALKAAVEQEYPGIKAIPVLTPGGGTDSAAFRALGVAAYGCLPIVAPQAQLAGMHGDNERLTVEQLVRGTRVVTAAVEAASTSGQP